MTFAPVFPRVLQPAFPQVESAAPASYWYLPSGVVVANCIGAYLAKGAADYASSLINLAHPGTHSLYGGVDPSWGAGTGWTGNGTTQYKLTGIVPENDQTWSMVVKYANVTNLGRMGQSSAGGEFSINPNANNVVGQIKNGGTIYPSKLLTGRLSICGNKGYRDGVLVSGTIGAWGGASTNEIALLAVFAGSPIAFIAGTVSSFAIYDVVLTQAQETEIGAAMP